MYYTIYQKKTDPFTQAWTMQSRGWMTFAQVLQTVAALEKRINHPPHALKVTSGETGDKLVLEWSRIEERHVQVTDKINSLAKSIGYRAELLEALWKTTMQKFISLSYSLLCHSWLSLALVYISRHYKKSWLGTGLAGGREMRLVLIKGRTMAVPPLKLFFVPSFDPTKTGLFWPIYFRLALAFCQKVEYIKVWKRCTRKP